MTREWKALACSRAQLRTPFPLHTHTDEQNRTQDEQERRAEERDRNSRKRVIKTSLKFSLAFFTAFAFGFQSLDSCVYVTLPVSNTFLLRLSCSRSSSGGSRSSSREATAATDGQGRRCRLFMAGLFLQRSPFGRLLQASLVCSSLAVSVAVAAGGPDGVGLRIQVSPCAFFLLCFVWRADVLRLPDDLPAALAGKTGNGRHQ